MRTMTYPIINTVVWISA